jgi:hypothetical protein
MRLAVVTPVLREEFAHYLEQLEALAAPRRGPA